MVVVDNIGTDYESKYLQEELPFSFEVNVSFKYSSYVFRVNNTGDQTYF